MGKFVANFRIEIGGLKREMTSQEQAAITDKIVTTVLMPELKAMGLMHPASSFGKHQQQLRPDVN